MKRSFAIKLVLVLYILLLIYIFTQFRTQFFEVGLVLTGTLLVINGIGTLLYFFAYKSGFLFYTPHVLLIFLGPVYAYFTSSGDWRELGAILVFLGALFLAFISFPVFFIVEPKKEVGKAE